MNEAEWADYDRQQKQVRDLRIEVEGARHVATLSARSYVMAVDAPDGPYKDADAAVILAMLRENLDAEAAATAAWREAIQAPQPISR